MKGAERPPVRVLHVMNGASGGAALSTLALMQHLRDRGIDAAAVCHSVGTAAEYAAVRDATEGRVTFVPLYGWNRKFRSPWYARPVKELKQGLRTGWARWTARRIAADCRRHGADLIHTNTILNPEGGLAARRLALPHVWHLRELVGPGCWFRLPLEGRRLGRFLSRRCSCIVANSETTASRVRDAVTPDLLAVVPNGIELAAFETIAAPAGSGRVVAGMVANLSSHFKKHALFIEAAALVDRSLPVEFRIYGAGATAPAEHVSPYVRDLLARVDALGLRDRFRFMGFYEDPARIMSEIDVLVHPSNLESFGRIVVEAMAASRPVVGVRGGGVAEIVQDETTGLLGDVDDASGLAARIERLARDAGLRQQLGAAGRRRARDQYSIEAHVAAMVAVYTRSMARPLTS